METIKLTIEELKNIIKECLNSNFISDRRGEKKSFNEIIDYNLYSRGFLNEIALHKKRFCRFAFRF